MAGCSQASPYLTCMAPRVAPSDFWDHWVYSHGAFQLGFMGTWGMTTNSRTNQNIDFHDWTTVFNSLPIAETDEAAGRSVDFWKDWVAHSSYDDYWERLTNRGKYGQVTAPAYNLGGWYDIFVAGTFENFSSMRKTWRFDRKPEKASSYVAPGCIRSALPRRRVISTSGGIRLSISGPRSCAGSTTGSRARTTASPTSRRSGCSSWEATSGGTSTNGRSTGPIGRSGICIPVATRTRCMEMERSARTLLRTSRPTRSSTIRRCPSRLSAETTAAIRR